MKINIFGLIIAFILGSIAFGWVGWLVFEMFIENQIIILILGCILGGFLGIFYIYMIDGIKDS